MSFSEFTNKDYEVIARDYAELKEAARKRCANDEELKVVQQAFEFANEAHKNIRRRSGEPYILHPIAVSKIVVNNIGLVSTFEFTCVAVGNGDGIHHNLCGIAPRCGRRHKFHGR